MSGIQTNNVFHGCGRLGNDPGVQILPSGRKIISFSIAIDRSWTTQEGEKKKKTNWIRCVAFHPLSKYVEACHVKKGSKVSVVGSIEIEQYVDSNTGAQKQSFSIWLSGFEKQSTDKGDENSTAGTTSANNAAQASAAAGPWNEEDPADLPY